MPGIKWITKYELEPSQEMYPKSVPRNLQLQIFHFTKIRGDKFSLLLF